MVKQFGTKISSSPVASRAYSKLQKLGTEIHLDFDMAAPKGEMGWFYGDRNQILINMNNHASIDEAVSTLVHEAAHAHRYFKGFKASTRYEEYVAFRREFLYRTEQRPSLQQRSMLWEDVQDMYSHLPQHKVPVSSW